MTASPSFDLRSGEASKRAAAAGVSQISLPVPFGSGGVNSWLVKDDPLTLVDVGCNWGGALLALEAGLAAHGVRLADIERVVVTHQHVDHAGLLEVVLDRSGAEVVGSHLLGPWLSSYSSERRADDRYRLDMLARHGVPELVVAALRTAAISAAGWGSEADLTQLVADGDILEFAGCSWTVLERPGHSPTDTMFLDAEHALLITGDHLMTEIPAHPFISRPLQTVGDTEPLMPLALPTYLRSLERTEELEDAVVLPGHGVPCIGHRQLAAHWREAELSNLQAVRDQLGDAPQSAYEIGSALLPGPTRRWVEITMSDILGSISLLLESGACTMEGDDPIRFRRANG